MELRAESIDCNLADDQLAARGMDWQRVGAAVVERRRRPDGFRLLLRAEPGLEEGLRALVAAEQQCCSWATWVVGEEGGHVALDVAGPEPQIDNLARAFGL